ncbi:MAG TPA: peptide-methionine (S)-S-oxide reductase MsrA [Enhygromyxa sp.]|nr:peptide-methionine (S)-S-oxide reductase MsrA [Enhygromyxa sp.]
MRRVAFALLLLAACSSPTADNGARTQTAPEQPREEIAIDTVALEAAGGVAYFAGGCFWGVEHFLEQIDGVLRVESGYMGGHVANPTYEDVSSQESGHLETVRVWFDPSKVAYEVVAKRFFEIHDPTQANGQGPDIGPEYLSAVFVTDDVQRAVVEGLIDQLEARGYAVVTQLKPAQGVTFWLAEDYHQNWYVNKREKPYCHAPVDRFGDG